MSFDSSKASSFDPFNYYKRMTKVLAHKKSLKVNLKSIPGATMGKKDKKTHFITREHIQAKFLANYNKQKNERNQQDGNAMQNRVNLKLGEVAAKKKKKEDVYINLPPSFFNSFSGSDMSMFKSSKQQPPDAEMTEEPNQPHQVVNGSHHSAGPAESFEIPQESFHHQRSNPINTFKMPRSLPVSQQKSIPNASQSNRANPVETFKRPEAPKAQQNQNSMQVTQRFNSIRPIESFFAVPEPVQQKSTPVGNEMKSNLSMDSIVSGCFVPPLASTPIEKMKPMMADPTEIFRLLKPAKPAQLLAKAPAPALKKPNPKLKSFVNLVDRVARQLDADGFSSLPDPIIAIRARLLKVSEASSRAPRLINETLLSDQSAVRRQADINAEALQILTYKEPQQYQRPRPVFYDGSQPMPKRQSKSQLPVEHSTYTKQLFAFSPKAKSQAIDLVDSPPAQFDEIFASQLSLDDTKALFRGDSPRMDLFDKSPANYEDDDGDFLFHSQESDAEEVADDSFNFCDDLFEDNARSDEIEKPKIDDNTYAIFRSPPKSRPHQSQRKSSQFNWEDKPQASQRKSQREEFIKPADSSLSTYKWTPKFDRVSRRLPSSPPKLMYEPRDYFDNSFNFY